MKYSYPFLGSMFSEQTADRPSDPKLKDIDSLVLWLTAAVFKLKPNRTTGLSFITKKRAGHPREA